MGEIICAEILPRLKQKFQFGHSCSVNVLTHISVPTSTPSPDLISISSIVKKSCSILCVSGIPYLRSTLDAALTVHTLTRKLNGGDGGDVGSELEGSSYDSTHRKAITLHLAHMW